MEKTKKTQFVDYLDKRCNVYDLPTFYTSSTIFKYIPEINNIYLDLDNYLKSSSIIIQSKIGSWFVLKRLWWYVIYTAVSSYFSNYLNGRRSREGNFCRRPNYDTKKKGMEIHMKVIIQFIIPLEKSLLRKRLEHFFIVDA